MSDAGKTSKSCIAHMIERVAVIETKLDMHIREERRTQTEMKWALRFILTTFVLTAIGMGGYLLSEGAPWGQPHTHIEETQK